jgi:hypothetical protein
MATIQVRGRIKNGAIELTDPIDVPEGTEVIVSVEPFTDLPPHVRDFLNLPAIGMWKDREDMADSAAWVEQQRAKWRERHRHPD